MPEEALARLVMSVVSELVIDDMRARAEAMVKDDASLIFRPQDLTDKLFEETLESMKKAAPLIQAPPP